MCDLHTDIDVYLQRIVPGIWFAVDGFSIHGDGASSCVCRSRKRRDNFAFPPTHGNIDNMCCTAVRLLGVKFVCLVF